MRRKAGTDKPTADRVVKDIRRKTRLIDDANGWGAGFADSPSVTCEASRVGFQRGACRGQLPVGITVIVMTTFLPIDTSVFSSSLLDTVVHQSE